MKSQVWELVPPGDYVLKLIAVEDGPTFTSDRTGEPEPTTKLKLEVDRGPSQGLGLSALINPANSGPRATPGGGPRPWRGARSTTTRRSTRRGTSRRWSGPRSGSRRTARASTAT